MPARAMRRTIVGLLSASVAVLAASATAAARIIEAQAISPPGESGFATTAAAPR